MILLTTPLNSPDFFLLLNIDSLDQSPIMDELFSPRISLGDPGDTPSSFVGSSFPGKPRRSGSGRGSEADGLDVRL